LLNQAWSILRLRSVKQRRKRCNINRQIYGGPFTPDSHVQGINEVRLTATPSRQPIRALRDRLGHGTPQESRLHSRLVDFVDDDVRQGLSRPIPKHSAPIRFVRCEEIHRCAGPLPECARQAYFRDGISFFDAAVDVSDIDERVRSTSYPTTRSPSATATRITAVAAKNTAPWRQLM